MGVSIPKYRESTRYTLPSTTAAGRLKAKEPYNISDMKELPSFVKDPILLAKDVKHVLTHRILLADFYLLEVEERPSLPDDYIWIKESEIENYGVPRLIEIMLEKIHQ